MAPDEFTGQLQKFQKLAGKQQAEQIALAEAEIEQKRTEQIALGACNIVPFPKRVKTEPFRSALTIEQSSLFVANRFKQEHFSREWTIDSPSGPLKRRLTVGKTSENDRARGVLKQVHQDAFYRLLQIWGDHRYQLGTVDGNSYGSFTVTAYHLVMAIRNNNSVRDYERVRSLLRDMTSVPVVIENEYLRNNETERQEFTLLSEVRWNEFRIDKQTKRPNRDGVSAVTVMFSSKVTEGFLDKRYKTILGAAYRSLGAPKQGGRGELARLLYPYLDAQLATKTNFHIKLRSLVERFGLTQHRKMSHRKRQFVPAVNALNGKPIKSEDHLLRVHLRESLEEDDYVLVAKREPNRQLRLFKEDEE